MTQNRNIELFALVFITLLTLAANLHAQTKTIISSDKKDSLNYDKSFVPFAPPVIIKGAPNVSKQVEIQKEQDLYLRSDQLNMVDSISPIKRDTLQ